MHLQHSQHRIEHLALLILIAISIGSLLVIQSAAGTCYARDSAAASSGRSSNSSPSPITGWIYNSVASGCATAR